MKPWIALILPDEKMKGALTNLLKANASAQVIGTFSSVEDALSDLEKKGEVIVILGFGSNPQHSLRQLKKLQVFGPFPILGVGDEKTITPILFDMFRLGMLDFIPFSTEEIENPTDHIFRKLSSTIDALAHTRVERVSWARLPSSRGTKKIDAQDAAHSCIIVGAPHGGLSSAIKLLCELPARSDVPLVSILPLPSTCEDSFIEELNKFSSWPIKRALPEEKITSGICYISTHSDSLGMGGTKEAGVSFISLPENSNSIDTLMAQCAEIFGAATIGILIDGFGDDGTDGLTSIRKYSGTAVTLRKGGGILTHASEEAARKNSVDLLLDRTALPETLNFIIDSFPDLLHLNHLIQYE
jgi:chemotaxis response regulator CheB